MLIIVDKPKDVTSFHIVHTCKKAFPGQKIGHGWTLDPMATGMLIIWIWKDTKCLGDIQTGKKEYLATIDFSKMTDTWDMEYRDLYQEFPVEKQDGNLWIIKDWTRHKAPEKKEIESKLKWLIPEAELPLTPFSAKKKEGTRFYELARKWQAIYENRVMKIEEIEIIDYSFPELKIIVKVWGWTYIRSIWYRIGQQFGLWWILTALRRTAVWEYKLENLEFQTLENTNLQYAKIRE